jgi:hypothetical protein
VPSTVNGFGTAVCGAGGFVSWGGAPDFDAVECFVALYMPVLPYKAVHTFHWDGWNYRQVPIAWSLGLVVRAFARRWLIAVGLVGGFLLIGGFTERDAPTKDVLFLSALALYVVAALGYWLLWVTDQRSRNLRRVLGPHDFGSSDPATWRGELLELLPGSRPLFGTDTYAAAVSVLLEDRKYGSAMYAARLAVAVEDAKYGEELTDMILRDPDVREALEVVRRDPKQWADVMEAGNTAAPPHASGPVTPGSTDITT